MDLVEECKIGQNDCKSTEKLPQSIEEKNNTDGAKNKEIDEILEFLLSTAERAQSEEDQLNPEAKYTKQTLIEETEEESIKSTKIYPEIYPEETPLEDTRLIEERKHSSNQEEPKTTNPEIDTSKKPRMERRTEIYPENSIGATRGSLQSERDKSTL